MTSETAYQRGLPLLERIERNVFPVTESGCWIWMLKIAQKTGYGSICVDDKDVLAHRASWTVFRGPIPAGLCVLHRCDVRACVNPDHLFLGTHSDNVQDCLAKGRNVDRRGSKNTRAKLTEDIVLAIRRSRVPNGILAVEYGIDARAIWALKREKAWRHVNFIGPHNRPQVAA